MNLLDTTDKLINKFRINIEQIIRCSDNTLEDIKNEAFIAVFNNLDSINKNDRVFINELKSKCLKFNKYGKRIESKERFEKFNEYENRMIDTKVNALDFNENDLCLLLSIKDYLGSDNYCFLLDYYRMGCDYVSNKHKISKELVRKRVSNLIKKVRDNIK